ncbi:hypothetical protein SLEP1_g10020 [Rubroshorea leprosula]|uniref:Uncharacterized protein n=1 Tax=Rubroshorea leprosula TaxID=152421 RepID=A0AAV5I6T5_9ROSI|nr:hypothetical protein SLEP1_g10020 [Rubroshorea leprosula]
MYGCSWRRRKVALVLEEALQSFGEEGRFGALGRDGEGYFGGINLWENWRSVDFALGDINHTALLVEEKVALVLEEALQSLEMKAILEPCESTARDVLAGLIYGRIGGVVRFSRATCPTNT